MTLLSGTIQPALLTLLSSTSTPPLSPLFSTHVDPSSPEALITSVRDTESERVESQAGPSTPHKSGAHRGDLAHEVIHIQSPDLRRTYIQAGCSSTAHRDRHRRSLKTDRADSVAHRKNGTRGSAGAGTDTDRAEPETEPLGIELPWVGMQVKRLGRREMSFEFGLVDSKGREGVVRVSSFKKTPTSHLSRTPPMIHLPLELPVEQDQTLTSWAEVSINLASLIPLFQSLPRAQRARASSASSSSSSSDGDAGEGQDQDGSGGEKAAGPVHAGNKRRKVSAPASALDLPSGGFGFVSYVRVYANCRSRRIWFAADGERTLSNSGKSARDEWALYAAAVESEPVEG